MFVRILFLLLLNFLINYNSASAQDLHFSNYQTFLPTINPSFTGFIPYENNIRLATISRQQWNGFLGKSAFQTSGFAFDMRNCLDFLKNKRFSRKNNKYAVSTFGLGISFIHDQTGTRSVGNNSNNSSPLTRNYLNISGSFIRPINDATYLNVGFKVGGAFHRINTGSLTFDEQFDGIAGLNSSVLGEFEGMDNLNSTTYDLGGGISFITLHKKWGIILGGTIDHIFNPVSYELISSVNPPELERKFTLQAKYSKSLYRKKSKNIGYNVRGFFLHQTPFQQIVLGADLFFQSKEDLNVSLGASLRNTRSVLNQRHNDAVLLTLNLNYKSFSYGFNYDINVSSLNVASSYYGAFEFSLTYFGKRKSKCAPVLEGCKIDENIHSILF